MRLCSEGGQFCYVGSVLTSSLQWWLYWRPILDSRVRFWDEGGQFCRSSSWSVWGVAKEKGWGKAMFLCGGSKGGPTKSEDRGKSLACESSGVVPLCLLMGEAISRC